MTKVVVVESPAKAKTINKYLGDEYRVIASFGHVRDLPSKDGSVRPDENFAMHWEIDERGMRQMANIRKALKGANQLILATDPDREGEAISWHVKSILEEGRLLKNIDVKRVCFHEITKTAIREAMAAPRELNQPLIDAYLARRALDYLVGFTLSPVLWHKLPGSRSAGRVQSVALRLICEREAEIEVFRPAEYWDITALCASAAGAPLEARLSRLRGKKLEQFDLNTSDLALEAKNFLQTLSFSVAAIEKKRTRRHPPPPFTTSTLQQEASRRLGMNTKHIMKLAQELYEGVDLGGETTGLITYMRTDGVSMAKEAVQAVREQAKKQFGEEFIPSSPRVYETKSKNAQEAHEAIRPTSIAYAPDQMRHALSADQARLYELIWKRTLASQMSSAEIDQTTILMEDPSGENELRSAGSTIAFEGFLKLADREPSADKLLPPVSKGEKITIRELLPAQHFTQPPPRYSEASLVKKMEEIGIGRPSTYASILEVLRNRNYVRMEDRRFIPEDRGRFVTAFLVSFFRRYVDADFTANLENQLDEVSGGREKWHDVMRNFWTDFSSAVDQTKDLKISDVVDALDADLGPHFFPDGPNGEDGRKCPACPTGRLGLKLGRHGPFIGCSNYRNEDAETRCSYTRNLELSDGSGLTEGPKNLGEHPESGQEIFLKQGPYGLYLQLGQEDAENKKPKRVAVPKSMDPNSIDLDTAVGLLSLPLKLGNHPQTGQGVEVGIGPFGPFAKMGSVYGTLGAQANVLETTLDEAVAAIDKKLASIRVLGEHPKDQGEITVRKGRFAPYVQHGKIVAPLPKGSDINDITLEEAVALLAEKGKPAKGRASAGAKKKTAPAKAAKADAKPARMAAKKPAAARKKTVKKAKTGSDGDA